MFSALSLLLSLQAVVPPVPDTLRLEVGSQEVDGRFYPEHRARNRVYMGDSKVPTVTWTNELKLADSAGIQIMRWTTRGGSGSGATADTWELLQTYNARTLAPLSYSLTTSTGVQMRFRIDGKRLHGKKRMPGDSADQVMDQTLDRLGFMVNASDLVPPAVGLRAGAVMTAPVWGPNMPAAETRVFTVVRQEAVSVEGSNVNAWRVEEHVEATGKLEAIWWLIEKSPFMVLAQVVLPDGKVQRITGVDLKDGEQ